ncbi:MAG: hypothetical protein BalsKO_21560 [Balneolaceae bacterium]
MLKLRKWLVIDLVLLRSYSNSMRLFILIFLLLFPNAIWAQNFEDDFSDGDFTFNPSWSGADSNFVVYSLDGNNVLRLNDNEAASSYLSTPSINATGAWEFFIQIDGSAPSDGNKAEIFLMSDIADLSGAVNGYAIRVGQSGDDVFKLLRIDGGSQTSILEDTTVFKAGGAYRVKVIRDGIGSWSLEVGEGYNGELKNAGASVSDNTYTTTSFFGVLVTYTSSRVNDYYFDFKIDPSPVITEPLFVDNFTRFSNTEIDLSFSREIDFTTVSILDFVLNGSVNPQSFSNDGSNALRITFTEAFSGGENELLVSGIESSTNDTILTDTTFTFFIFDDYESGDVVINEFLKDPPTGSGIPEYVELKNTSSKILNLKNWQIGDNNSLTDISNEDVILFPDSFLVVTSNPEGIITAFGEGAYLDISLPALNNTTDQIRIFDENGVMIDSLEYTSDWGGVDVALERKLVELASIFQANWGDSPNAVGTPGKENEVEMDTTPPDIESFEFLNNSTLQIIFTEEIKEASAIDKENYNPGARLDNDFSTPAISSVTFLEPDSVLIFFSPAFRGDNNGENFGFTISNQEDIFGNVSFQLLFNFEFREFDSAFEGAVVINEFMYDPADEYSEFVEIYNWTNSTFNLKDWTFNDNSGSRKIITSSDYFLGPDDYLVLAGDSTIIENFPETPLLDVSGFPSLNNSNDDLVLRNENGSLIDSLTYFSAWGGDEVSLRAEIRKGVWYISSKLRGDSPSQNLGTPGMRNEIISDTEAPIIVESLILLDRDVQLIFDEPLIESAATDILNYELQPGFNFSNRTTEISELDFREDTISITLSMQLEDGDEFEIIVRNQEDIFGNIQASQTVSFTYVEIQTAVKGDIVVNEILYRRKDELSPEFVELFNASEKNFDLSGWIFKDASSSRTILPANTFLKAGDYLLLTDREDFAQSLDEAIYLSSFPSLNDSGDQIIIKDENGSTMDSLFYQSSWGGNSPGISVERKDPRKASNDESNWRSSTAQEGFSAGTQSSVFEEDVTPPEIIFATQIEDVVKIVFSEFVEPDDQTVFFVNENEAELLEVGSNMVSIEWIPGSVTVEKNSFQNNLDVEILNLKDVKGNIASEISSSIASPISKGSIIINEIMFDPLADSEDNLPDQTEYIELFNRSSSAVSLEGISLHDAPDEENEVHSLFPVSSQFKWIQPNGFFLIYSEDEAETFADSKTARYFSMESESDQFTMQIDRSSLSLASSGDAIYLADSTGATIDSVFFDESWQNPNIFDTDGIALERINPEGESNSERNWSSSTHVSGGTPNTENSIFQRPGTAPESSGISFTPNPFSPDDDGFEDNLFINYTLDAPDYLLRVRIFDRYGREVRKLVDGQQAGFEGSLIWNGLTDDRKKNRVGIYIVLFEAYNSANGSDRTFKETVVLARMF